jgi:hypothetical protein
MTEESTTTQGSRKFAIVLFLGLAVLAAAGLLYWGRTFRRYIRESLMARVTSAHYEILSPPGTLSQQAMEDFAARREPLFSALNKKLGGADSNAEIRVIFDPEFSASPADENTPPRYSVTKTTIRTKLAGNTPQLPSSADSEALLAAAWGQPGNPQIARWAAIWLLGEWRGAEIGMAAAGVEQRLGHKKVAALLVDPGGEIASSEDRSLLGAAWVSEIAEFGGVPAVRKIYSDRMPHPNVAEVAKDLGTTPLELDRKWQLWMYAYLAGMPAMPSDSAMPMDMPMPVGTP